MAPWCDGQRGRANLNAPLIFDYDFYTSNANRAATFQRRTRIENMANLHRIYPNSHPDNRCRGCHSLPPSVQTVTHNLSAWSSSTNGIIIRQDNIFGFLEWVLSIYGFMIARSYLFCQRRHFEAWYHILWLPEYPNNRCGCSNNVY